MDIALFGGSFDPPHIGHEEIVRLALKNLDIYKLFIMPTFLNPFKNEYFLEPNLRLNLCKKLWQNLNKVEICDYEILQNRPVPTIESVKFLYSKFNIKNFYLIIGADNLNNLYKWYEFNELKKIVKFVVATRNDIKIPSNLQKLNLNVKISSSNLRKNLDLNFVPDLIKDDVFKIYKRINMEKIIKKIATLLDEKKAENIEIIDMSDKDYIAKFVVIATTLTGKHSASLLDELSTTLKPMGEKFLNVETSDEWSVIDMGDILIHLMSEKYRAKYNIEEFLDKLKKGEN
ncbi:nicotinate (nicotinamide) nucleotide adenylyltransferase [Campylobacter sp. FMV-PI01]|uniref:Multifunctional fusion protein n=1 Tax=Campylobacter portucalensis TaxID=2608384 RepID=A0A6L5WHE5_9BACT|nr:nicotinate (nicotinamide) nucleotide adenylyltransferase [Campylobacter portucalensis]MSN95617.1 nicotinate (nicotinamide) nucleotide adenylyltransferase [Campylobacter portucalensis]